MNTLRALIATLGITCASLVLAGTPVAIIEDIQANNTELAFMDYVHEGQVIRLADTENITLGYLQSCQREVITGGTVTIGKHRSKVSKGQVLREEVECNGGQANLSGQQAGTSGALAFRSGSSAGKPEVTIYGTAPVFRLHAANSRVTVEPVNRRGQSHTIEVQGHHVDLADKSISLSPGVYKARVGNKSKLFKVHHRAEPGKAPIITRLVDL